MNSLPTARGDQIIARQIIRRLIWCLRHNFSHAYRVKTEERIRALWGQR